MSIKGSSSFPCTYNINLYIKGTFPLYTALIAYFNKITSEYVFFFLSFGVDRIHCTVKPVYKGHSREPKNVAFMRSCPLIYTG